MGVAHGEWFDFTNIIEKQINYKSW